jgi:hypothetical protein
VISIQAPQNQPYAKIDLNSRPIVEVDLGMPVKGASLPHPDDTDPLTIIQGLLRRVAIEPPQLNKTIYSDLANRFIPKLIAALFPDPLSIWEDFSAKTWLGQVSYELWRVLQLQKTKDNMNGILDNDFDFMDTQIKRWFRVDGFIKDECYTEFKHARAINARKDEAKVTLGPIFKVIENLVFKLKFFIKKIPKTERAKHLLDFLNDPYSLFASTDFTSFEACFRTFVMKTFEKPLYMYLLKGTPIELMFEKIYDHFILGINSIFFKYFKVKIEGTRMTGEMNTSLGNGWTNLCLMLYVLEQSGYDIWTDVFNFPLRIEGDDGLTRTDPVVKMKDYLFYELGFKVKIDYFEKINLASFCGNVFDPEDLVIIPDIRKVLASFGWTRARYARSKKAKHKALLRAKAFSLLYEYPGCPVLQSLATKTLELTKGFRAKFDIKNDYERQFFHQMMTDIKQKYGSNSLPIREVPRNTRLLVEELYSIPINVQLELEAYFHSLTEIGPLDHPYLSMILPSLWFESNYHYVRKYERKFERFFWRHECDPIPWNEDFVRNVYSKYQITANATRSLI